MTTFKLHLGDCVQSLQQMPEQSVQCCVTSPPYFGLRDYGHDGQIGLEATPDEFVAKLVTVFREVRRVLKNDGTLWLNLGDSYAGSGKGPAGNFGKTNDERNLSHTKSSGLVPDGLKAKDLIGIPWRVAFALQADGWWLRQDIIWHKPNPMPESVRDRCTKSHEYIFLLSKSANYFYNYEAVMEPAAESTVERLSQPTLEKQAGSNRVPFKTNGAMKAVGSLDERNRRSVWTINTQPYKGAHFATFPTEIPQVCILAGTKAGDTVLDPFGGSGTTGAVALDLGRSAILCELNPKYGELIRQRCSTTVGFGF